jgi:hypothetical protein
MLGKGGGATRSGGSEERARQRRGEGEATSRRRDAGGAPSQVEDVARDGRGGESGMYRLDSGFQVKKRRDRFAKMPARSSFRDGGSTIDD